jgi:REP element-mobilizing transposase RayT
MARQLSFLRKLRLEPSRIEHGGEVRLHRRKLSRPIDLRRSLHVVLRSARARGAWSLRRFQNDAIVRAVLRRFARRYAIRVYRFANVGNHLHLLLRSPSRLALQDFLRTFAGITARRVTGARKGRPVGRFWDFLAYSRIVRWGRDFRGVKAYVMRNELEGLGIAPARPRRKPAASRSPPLIPLREG